MNIQLEKAILRLSGTENSKFLQKFTSNDVQKKDFSHNYFLNNQGRYLADFFVFNTEDNLLYLVVDKETATSLTKKLNLFKLRSDVKIEDVSDQYSCVYTRSVDLQNQVAIHPDPRFKAMGYWALIQGIAECNGAQYLDDKFKYSVIDGFLDMVYEKSIPIEFGADDLNSIDFNKGCYVGQEVISRAKNTGVIRKKIYKLSADEPIFGMELHNALELSEFKITDQEGNKIGIACSAYKNMAIVQLREEKYLQLTEKKAIINDKLVTIEIPEWRSANS